MSLGRAWFLGLPFNYFPRALQNKNRRDASAGTKIMLGKYLAEVNLFEANLREKEEGELSRIGQQRSALPNP